MYQLINSGGLEYVKPPTKAVYKKHLQKNSFKNGTKKTKIKESFLILKYKNTIIISVFGNHNMFNPLTYQISRNDNEI